LSPRGGEKPCAVYLTGDFRMGWTGRAPVKPAQDWRRLDDRITASLPIFVRAVTNPSRGAY